MKFGGTLLESEKNFQNVIHIIKSYKELENNELIIIVSALNGITDKIFNFKTDIKNRNNNNLVKNIQEIKEIHLDLIDKVIFDNKLKIELINIIQTLLNELSNILSGISILGEITSKTLDHLLSFGERLSAPIVSFALRDKGIDTIYLSGKEVGILTDSNFGEAKPLMDTTKLRVSHKIEPILRKNIVPVITGFIGIDQDFNITTIGRGGSDYTATIIASSINANEVWLWSDSDGLLSADKEIVKDAKVIKEISFSEAIELSMFGTKYMHPRALEPVMDSKIIVRIRNANNLKQKGTLILQNVQKKSNEIVKSITSIKNTALIDVSGGGLIGSPGTAAKIFEALAKNKVNIMMISQTPSESSITIVVKQQDLDNAITTLELKFLGKLIKRIDINDNVAVIAVVGSGMRGIKGVAARTFSSIAKKDINVIMIAQGSSELNLAFVIDQNNCDDAVRALHSEFIE